MTDTTATDTTTTGADAPVGAELYATGMEIHRRMPYFLKAKIAQRYGIDGGSKLATAMWIVLGAADYLHFVETGRHDYEQFEAMTEDDLTTYLTDRAHLVMPDKSQQ